MNIKAIFLPTMSAALLILSGCTIDPYTGESQASKTGSGAAIGAAVGAGIGALTASKKDRGKGALIGAASGAALGGGIGLYMDNQEAKLRATLRNTGVSVTRSGDQIVLNMPNSLTFDTNSAILKPFGTETLRSVALVTKEFNRTSINIVGHTDSTGNNAINQPLSQNRANSVANALVHEGISSGRMSVYGAGASRPIASNGDEQGRAQNRRVEITLSPLQ